jgi:CRP-like cAMP-binding protein
LLDVLYNERRALFGCLVIALGTALVAASLMHLAEANVQPAKLGTIPEAFWWAIVTIGTIGYGDVVPVTALGKLIATCTIFAGLVLMALPVGIIATAFAEQIRRRDFIVTWGMISRVPLFAELDATEISDVMELLRAQVVEAGEVVMRAGDAARSMYFIAAGEVEIEIKGKKERIRLGVGQFFGEVALLRRTRRTATVTAVTRTNLLGLDAHDLHALMQRDRRIAERIKEVVEDRVGRRGGAVKREIAAVVEEGKEGKEGGPRNPSRHGRACPGHPCRSFVDASRLGPGARSGITNAYAPIAFFRLASTLSRKPVVESHFWSAPTSSARSLVIEPASTVSTQTLSRVVANFASAALLSSLARWARPRVQAKIDAIELVEVSLPF